MRNGYEGFEFYNGYAKAKGFSGVLNEPIVAITHTHLHQGTPSNHPRGNEPFKHKLKCNL